MKKPYLIRLFALSILMVAFQLPTTQINAQPVTVTMTIDYDLWNTPNADKYDAISFADNTPGNPNRTPQERKGRSFVTEVGNSRNQLFTWTTKVVNKDGKELNDVDIILVSVTRKPSEGGDTLLTKSWYNSEDNGNTINGRTRQAFQGGHANPNNPGTRIYIERYIISFAVNKGNNEYDTFTVDPVIRGNQ